MHASMMQSVPTWVFGLFALETSAAFVLFSGALLGRAMALWSMARRCPVGLPA